MVDFESSFAPEIRSLEHDQPQEPTPSPDSGLGGSPQALKIETLSADEVQRNDLRNPEAEPQKRLSRQDKQTNHEKNRLSLGFLKRNPPILADPKENSGIDTSTDDGSSSSPTTRSRSKSGSRSKSANRRSFFRASEDENVASPRSYDGQRSMGDDHRPITAESSPMSTSSMGSNVKKRLSLLKIGKKSSKASVGVDSVAEE